MDRPDLGLWAIADGAGGHECGQLAAEIVTEALEAMPGDLSPADLLPAVRACIGEAHQRLRAEAARRGNGVTLASTIVVLLAGRSHYACLWAGDSRAYRVRNGELLAITRDHSLVQEMLDAGAISAEEAAAHPRGNVITRAVGCDAALVLDKATEVLCSGDRFLLCSDGLCKTLGDIELCALLALPPDAQPAELLVAAALARSAADNVSAVVVDVL